MGDDTDLYLLGSDAGYAFIAPLGEMHTKNKKGKAVLRVPPGAGVLTPQHITDPEEDWLAIITTAGYLTGPGAREAAGLPPGTGPYKADSFTAEELRDLVGAARAHGLSTLAHCSGRAGLELAVAKGIDSIEHGFFMSEDILRAMARQGTLWVPTWSPVDFQRRRPDILGLDDAAVDGLTRILAQHRAMIARAAELGVRLTAGSDAGSQGVVHGRALIDELRAFADAGLGIETILASATSVPRKSWGLDGGILHPGAKTDMACYARIPTATDLSALDRAQMVVIGDASGRKRIGAPIGRIPPLQCGHAMC